MRDADSMTRASVSRAGWAFLLLSVLWLLQSALWTDRVPLVLRGLVAAVAVAAAVRPSIALVVVAGVAPLSHFIVTRLTGAYPFALAESLVTAFFAGYLWWRRRAFVSPRTSAHDPLASPAQVFTIVVLASCAVQLRVVQVQTDDAWPFILQVLEYVRTASLLCPGGRSCDESLAFLQVAALGIGGVALLRATRTLCVQRPDLPRKLATALVVCGAIAATLSFVEPLQVARAGSQGLFTVLRRDRWSTPAIPSLNTAGPFFLMLGFVAIGLWRLGARRTQLMLVAAVVMFASMWLTKTRSSIVAGFSVITALALWSAAAKSAWLSRRRGVLAASVAAAVLMALLLVLLNPFHVLAGGITRSIRFRFLFADVGLRMFSTAPLTGVGIGQYVVEYLQFASPQILRLDARVNNAHNYLLWVAAELGILGVGSFVWLLFKAFTDAERRALESGDAFRTMLLVALAGFVFTWATGQPIEIPTVACAFWITLGVAAGAGAAAEGKPSSSMPRRGWERLLVPVLGLALAASVPVRASQQIDRRDLSSVRRGFYNDGVTADGRTFLWAGPRVRFFVRATTAALDVPIAALLPATPNGARVTIAVDGRPLPPVVLSREWQIVRLQPSPDTWRRARYWIVSMTVEPIDPPGVLLDSDKRIAIAEMESVPDWRLAR